MLSAETSAMQGEVKTLVTSGRGLNPEELTSMIMPKIIYIGPDAPEDIRIAGEAQMARLEALLKHYFAQAQRSQNTTTFNVLMQAGQVEAAEIVRKL